MRTGCLAGLRDPTREPHPRGVGLLPSNKDKRGMARTNHYPLACSHILRPRCLDLHCERCALNQKMTDGSRNVVAGEPHELVNGSKGALTFGKYRSRST